MLGESGHPEGVAGSVDKRTASMVENEAPDGAFKRSTTVVADSMVNVALWLLLLSATVLFVCARHMTDADAVISS